MPPRSTIPTFTIRFQLLGSSDCNNPSAISKEQILAWEKQGVIEYLGETKDVRPFVESASCVVLPSSYKEGVPRVLLEAMSMGKAIIATNIAGCKECRPTFYTLWKSPYRAKWYPYPTQRRARSKPCDDSPCLKHTAKHSPKHFNTNGGKC